MKKQSNRIPRFADLLLRFILMEEAYAEKSGDLEEAYKSLLKQNKIFKARLWLWLQVIRAVPSCFSQSIYWRTLMFRNYCKSAVRNLKKNKSYSLINLAGLSIGMACFIFISLWVGNELGYDRFHENKDRLFRVVNKFPTGKYSASHTYAIYPYLKANYPEVQEVSRVWPWHRSLVKYGDKSFEENGYYLTDPGFFKMFSFPFIHGTSETALPDKNSIVLTQETAQRYFGNENPLGKILYLDTFDTDMKVTGVVADIPANSTLQFNMVSRVEGLGEDRLARWAEWVSHGYVMLQQGDTVDAVNAKMAGLYQEFISPDYEVVPLLQPLTDVHLRQAGNSGRITKIYTFSLIAVFILLMACINFMNLSTARSAQRAREVGMRKVIGATRSQVAIQFLGEAGLFSIVSMGFALLCVWAVLPVFNSFSGQALTLFSKNNASLFLILFITTIITGLISGSYPALILSSFRPIHTLKNRLIKRRGGSTFRKVLIVFQFSISVGLILCTLIVSKQLRFIQNKDLGSNRNNVVTLYNNQDLADSFTVFKEELRNKPGVLNVTSAAQRPFQVGQVVPINWKGNPSGESEGWEYTMADFDFFETFEMEIVQGRSFSEKFPTDIKNACIINEIAAKRLGLENPIGMELYFGHMALDESLRNVRIIGVVKDFHSRSLYSSIKPFLFRIYRPYHQYIFIKVDALRIPEALRNIASVFSKYAPDHQFGYEFADQAFSRQYSSEMELRKLFNLFCILSIIVACLGLFGLASFTTDQKTKEIGIRKVFGASVPGIVGLTTKEFMKWIVLANLIAGPMGYYFMIRWMNNFVYKTSIGPVVFLMASGLTLLIAFATISFQTIKAALANPIDSLRYE